MAALKAVVLDDKVALKILQHCNEALPQLATGQLLGLDVGQTLEVTDCFPFPASGAAEDDLDENTGTTYQLDMMRCLREVNVDNNTVGWYQSATMGTFQTAELIETFVNYHENIKKCVCVVYDPQRSQRGSLALRAIRLKDSFVELYKQEKLSAKDLREANLSWRDVFVDVPVKISSSPLTQALIAELQPAQALTAADLDRLDLSCQPFMEKNIQSLLECVDDLINEQQKVTMYHKNVARQAQMMAAWLQKRKAENQTRRAAGEELLPEEDPSQFKPIPEPNLLDSYLVTSQISTYCDQVNIASTQSMEKLFLVEALQKGLV
eukprot:CAMPEP_0119107122 /NCGR_PEP_ID=MMETSP1180-20130426/7990_1 /TAXON_ID=3052 ORGANISM="Chlamydomonas cf sp, Strain CCMP681" /NCGR_SAMPLE_ID=MMETSP1180 /ASSEMBLY_ACC=CAM_ASM_000741 /LENGTH=321 /DNA_ID=CAMNT_0007092561 /DNA_START=50 /DNA_END=1015 /DNA_ORIENTATION=-